MVRQCQVCGKIGSLHPELYFHSSDSTIDESHSRKSGIKLLVVLVSIGHIGLIKSECSFEYKHLYCTNLENAEDILFLEAKKKSENSDVTTAYLRNITGNISNETFSLFPNIQSLDIQFSAIDEFSPNSTTLNTLYIMNNLKFPNLTKKLMKDYCKHFTILFIVNNTGVVIEEGALKHVQNLTQLTISKQNITHLTKGFLEGLENLTYLNLNQNDINSIDKDAFDDLLELNYLDLSENKFKIIETKTFEKLKVLETLELYGLVLDEFNPNVFSKQRELKALGLPTLLIKKKLDLQVLIKAFPKLESIGVENEDKEDKDVAEFLKKCKVAGFHIRYLSTNNS